MPLRTRERYAVGGGWDTRGLSSLGEGARREAVRDLAPLFLIAGAAVLLVTMKGGR